MPDAPFPADMMPCIEKFFREVHPTLKPGQDVYNEVFATDYFFPLQRKRELARMMQIARSIEPRTVMEIGADKGGSVYSWCMGLPTVKNVIACEIRGTPYRHLFEEAFPNTDFYWLDGMSSYDPMVVNDMDHWTCYDGDIIDVLFIDGDKLGMLKDFEAYLPLMRKPGGIVFLHDVQDHDPSLQFREIVKRGYKTEVILDKSEYFNLPFDFKPRNAWEGWLQHWRGRSCGVGVVYF